jgi:hypothetical protein
MKRIKHQLTGLTEQGCFRLQKGCNNLSPRKRIIIILFLCSAFGLISLYMTASSFYSIWRGDQQINKKQQFNNESGTHHSKVTTDSIIKPSKQLEYE